LSRMLYGSDYPFTPETMVEAMIEELNSTRLLNADDRRAMEHGNAMKLFARS
jgi:6-methylsalicylate decarboxylase